MGIFKFYAIWLASIIISTGYGQDPHSDESELIKLDDAWIAAEVARDKPALERILDENFMATFSSGKTIDRTAYIEWIMKSDIKPFEVNHELIQVHGDAALVIDASTGGKTKFTWIAVRKNGQWRVISETFTTVTYQE